MLSPAPTAARRGPVFVALAAAVLVLAGVLRCHALGGRSLWTDEYLSLECSAGWGRSDLRVAGSNAAAPDLIGLGHARPWTAIWGSVAADENHPPLYFLLLRAWRSAFGDSATAVRSLSVVASVAAVGLMMAAGAEAFGPTAGLCAGLLMAVAAPQLREAQDARAYMPVTAVAVAALWAVVRIDHRGPNRRRVATLSAALLVLPLLHYMALATVGAVAVYAAVGMRGPGRRAVLGAVGVAAAVYAVCWGPHLVGQHRRMLDATRWLADPAAGHGGRVVADLLSAPVRLLVDAAPAAAVTGGCVALLVPPLLVWGGRRGRSRTRGLGLNSASTTRSGGYCRIRRVAAVPKGRSSLAEERPFGTAATRRKRDAISRTVYTGRGTDADGRGSTAAAHRLLLPWLWLAVPVAVAGVIDGAGSRHSLAFAKYTLAGAPGLYLLLGAVAATGRRLACVPAVAVAAGCLAFLPDVYHPVEPDWRVLARAVVERTALGEPVVLVAPPRAASAADEVSGMRVVGLEYCLAHLAGGGRDVYVLDGPPAGAALAALRRARHACVIGGPSPVTDRLLSGLTIDRTEMFVGLGVVGTAVRPTPTLAIAR